MICAIVDAYGIARYLPEALRRYGVAYIHVRSQSPDVHLTYRAEDFDVDIEHRGDVAATARTLRDHGVGIVIAGAESGVLLADALSAELGTRGNGMSRPAVRRDKHGMAMAVSEAGLATARTLLTADAEEAVAWARESKPAPVVLKPVASAGTDRVFFCGSDDEIRGAHALIMSGQNRYGGPDTAVLVQECLVGAEHFVNTVSVDGVHRTVEIWRYNKRPAPGGRSINDFDEPLPPGSPAYEALSAYTWQVLDALEIRNGTAHTEVMLTEAGPVLVECAARPGGAQVPDVVRACLGTDQLDCLAQSIAHPERVLDGTLSTSRIERYLRYVNLITPRDGVVPDHDGWAPVRALESYTDMVLTIPSGDPAPETVDLVTSAGYVYLTSSDPSRLEADYHRLRALEAGGLYDTSRPQPLTTARQAG
ncbi:hypothetical protein [Streptomyces sp. SP18CS02]|uniref:hypothetical protein n=1 Tax=Streptomyces sp. SP18CS02 TaxID=3002531 RepID=UPI002E7715FA|nr:hypothetical protein [Streptomyces sp. SP18CS02]MEE1751922.1 hypothetical protein [Streptomyces sp. SP18CS02]